MVALLAACTRTREDPSHPSRVVTEARQPARAADPRPAIVCFGDSLTAGFGVDPGKSYPDLLQQEVDRRGYRYRVVNLGVSGDTTQDGLERLPLVLAEKPRIVVLEFGANDGLRGQPAAIAEGNLALEGSLPCNTNGGLIGEGYIHGLNLVLEATRQLRGTAVNQVPDAQTVLVSSSRTGAILTT